MARTITNPAENSEIDSSVIRTELQALETELADTTSGHNHDGSNSRSLTFSLESAWPIGSVYINNAVNTNPATLLGFGTWSSIGAGKVLVGVDTNQTEFDTLGETGGTKTHQLSSTEMPQHSHSVDPPSTSTGNQSVYHTHAPNGAGTFMINTGGNGPIGTGTAPVNRLDNITSTESTNHTHTVDIASFTSGNAGSNGFHNNLQPYLTVYFWARTA